MKQIEEILRKTIASKIISPEIDYENYVHLDLSTENIALENEILKTAQDYELFVEKYLEKNKVKIAFGGYLEKRNLYKRSFVFKDNITNERNIHIGLDLWINEQAPIFAPIAGKIHSFKNNTALGDYGPTIILKHNIEDFVFFTLYGHLSEKSIENLEIEQNFEQGEQIANLGLPPINGDYAPHLHFQIILDLQNNNGDYPGVCTENDVDFYKMNCPDPNLLLKIG